MGTRNKRWAQNKSGFGFRMLQKMGWSEGKGLGKNEDGEKTFVKTARRPDNEGLGIETDLVGDKHFNKTMSDFDKLLAGLSESNSTSNKKSTKKKRKKRALTANTKAHQSRIRSKNVRTYSKQDLSVILGGVPIKQRDKEDEETGDAKATNNKLSKKAKKNAKNSNKKRKRKRVTKKKIKGDKKTSAKKKKKPNPKPNTKKNKKKKNKKVKRT